MTIGKDVCDIYPSTSLKVTHFLKIKVLGNQNDEYVSSFRTLFRYSDR